MTDHTDSSVPIIQLYSGLVEGSAATEVMPDVARSWEISAGGRIYVFHLRDDVHWSDGAPVTARDFEYAWKRTLNPASGSPNASLLYDIKGARAFHQGETPDPGSVGVRAPDDLTLVIEMEGPTGYFLSLLACTATYPVPRHMLEAHGEAWTERSNIVTNGAFRLETWERGKSMTLARYPEYHGNFTGNLQRVELSLRQDISSEHLEMCEAGSLDVLDLGSIPISERDRARQAHAG
jgi:oligopeptide transport system substrate-binding protein